MQKGDIVELLHHTLKPDPGNGIAGGEVNNDEPAAGLGVALLQCRIEGEASESAIVARQRQPKDGAIGGKGKSAGIARAEGDWLEAMGINID